MNGYQAAVVCPQCGTSTAVHSIQELAAMARARLGEFQQGFPGAGQQQGVPGAGQQGGVPGYMQAPRSGPIPGPGGSAGGGYRPDLSSGSDRFTLGEDLAGLAMSQTAKFVGRAIGRRMQQVAQQAAQRAAQQGQGGMPGNAETMLRTQIAIADRHPDVCACLNDGVIFLAGGQRTMPMPDLSTLTVEQADALVATLRSG